MKVSKNELSAALKKSFEGLGFSYGDYIDAAAMVSWAQMAGLNGLEILDHALPFLDSATGQSRALSYSSDSANPVLDAQGASCLLCASQIIDLACALARKNRSVTLRLDNCRNRLLVLERLSNAAQRGLNLAAGWRSQDSFYMATIAAGESFPALTTLPYKTSFKTEDSEIKQSLFIICTVEQRSLPDLLAEISPTEISHQAGNTCSAQSLRQAWVDALEQGIDMPSALWEKLDQLTARVLVESTESSRAGAGE